MKRTVFFALCLTVGSGLGLSGRALAQHHRAPPKPRVQLAILLDTSGSMSGLIGH